MQTKHRIKGLLVSLLLVAAGCDSDPTVEIDRTIQSVQVTASDAQVQVGQSAVLTAVAKQADGTIRTDVEIQWTVSDTSVATLTHTGFTATLFTKKAGAVTVIAAVGGKTAQVNVAVSAAPNPVPQLESLVPNNAVVGTATTIRINGVNFNEQTQVRWNGQTVMAVTFVNSTQLILNLTAQQLALDGIFTVAVETPAPGGGVSPPLLFQVVSAVASVEINAPWDLMLWPGERLDLAAVAKDRQGRILPDRTITWSSSDQSVVSVSATGHVIAQKVGDNVQIKATADGVVGYTSISVHATPAYDLVYNARDDDGRGPSTIFIMTPGVPGRTRLLPAGMLGKEPAPSPDGQRIAFVSRVNDNNQDIYVMNRDGSNIRRLTTDAAIDDQPTWSPDGQRIAFRTLREGYSDIWVMNADGSGQVSKTGGTYRIGNPASSNPTWSPDGSHLVFEFKDAGVTPTRSILMKLRLSDNHVSPLLNNPEYDYHEPYFSDDASFMAYRTVARVSSPGEVSIQFANGLTGGGWGFINYPGPGINPSVSPDKKFVAYEWSPDGSTNVRGIYVTTIGYHLRKSVGVGTLAGNPANPAWVKR